MINAKLIRLDGAMISSQDTRRRCLKKRAARA